MKYFFSFLVLFFVVQNVFGQSDDNQPQDNWLDQYKILRGPFLFHRYDLYSKQDILIAKEKLPALINGKAKNEWEGKYYSNLSEVGFSQLHWDKENGFLEFNIYTCLPELRDLKFGNVKDSAETIEFIPNPSEDSPLKDLKPNKFVKVKWGQSHYLVEENSLEEFYEKAVGIYVDPNLDAGENDEYIQPKWTNFWEGSGEIDFNTLPMLPRGYEKYQRLPIQSTIVSLGKRTIERDRQLGNTAYSEGAFLEVELGVGKNNGVKKGMIFELPKATELIVITSVRENKATGIIYRDIDEKQKDICRNENFDSIPCPKISTGLKVQTQLGLLQF